MATASNLDAVVILDWRGPEMLVNFLIGGAIFGYAGFALVRFINKSKQGKCAACSVQKNCTSQSNCQPNSLNK